MFRRNMLGVLDLFLPISSHTTFDTAFTADWNRLYLRRSTGAVHCFAKWLNRAPSHSLARQERPCAVTTFQKRTTRVGIRFHSLWVVSHRTTRFMSSDELVGHGLKGLLTAEARPRKEHVYETLTTSRQIMCNMVGRPDQHKSRTVPRH